MFAYISGTIKSAEEHSIIITPEGTPGLGFEISIPQEYGFGVGQKCALELYTHTTQEHGSSLYGFKTTQEKQTFQLILGCSGFGPKVALSLVGAFSCPAFVAAIMSSDVKLLSKVDGVGARKAESLVMQLKDKIKKLSFSSELTQQQPDTSQSTALSIKKIHEVLASLGYGRPEIAATFDYLREQQLSNRPFDELIRIALSFLSKK